MLDPLTVSVGFILGTIGYVLYQRFFHPLAKFPGPFFAFTGFWRFYHELRGDLPQVIHKYHKRYGAFIRVAPNEIDTNAAEVVDVVYIKGGRHYPKSDFYDGFTAIRPNIFGTRDENLHALRRKQMAYAFSHAGLVKMSYIFDRHVGALVSKLEQRAKAGQQFNFSDVLKFYSHDSNGDLSLGIQFHMQDNDDPALMPPLNDHIALAKLTGYVPWTKKWFDRYGRHIPWPYLQKLLRTRAWMKQEASRVTNLEFKRVGRNDGVEIQDLPEEEEEEPGRINLFNCLVRAREPETKALIERDDVTSNAITFLTAGSHSTSASLEILFWYLCRYPQVQKEMQTEIDSVFGSPDGEEDVLDFQGLEMKLPLTAAVFKEIFRLGPTFQHPAPRLTPDESDPKYPTIIAGQVIPPGYNISASVFSLHRNQEIWGDDADAFVPRRWFEPETKQKEKLLMHFGAGHRACIGRNQSLIMIWKAVVEVMRRFDIEFADASKEMKKKDIELHVCGFAELENPLIVNVSKRS